MELTQDWRKHQRTFYPARKEASSGEGPIYLIEDQGVVLSLYAEGEDLSEWAGMTVSELRAQFAPRPVLAASQIQMKDWLSQALSESQLPTQVKLVRNLWSQSVKVEEKALATRALPGRMHFLIDSLERSWWCRVLPSSFAILIRLEEASEQFRDFILVYRKGRLEHYGDPDLSFLSEDRRRDLADVSRYLGERLSVPVQSVQMLEQDWKLWSDQSHPWKEIAWAIQSKRLQLVPFRWQCVSLVATRGFIGI